MRLPAKSAELKAIPVMLPPGRARLTTSRSQLDGGRCKDDRHRTSHFLGCNCGRASYDATITSPLIAIALLPELWKLVQVAVGEAKFDNYILAVDVSLFS